MEFPKKNRLKIFGREWWEIVAWIIILIIIVWAIVKEFQVRDCYDGLQDCGTEWNWDPQDGDTKADLLQRIDFGNKAEREIVSRRLVMILGFFLTFIIFWYFTKKPVPDILEFLIVMIIIMATIWFGFRYHESHYLFPITERTNGSIDELRYELGLAERPDNVLD